MTEQQQQSTIVEILYVFTPELCKQFQMFTSTIVEILYVFTPVGVGGICCWNLQ